MREENGMNVDKRVLRIVALSSLAVLLLTFFLSSGQIGKLLCAAICVAFAAVIFVTVKKRAIFSMNKREVLMLMSLIAIVYLILYYFTGFAFGYYNSLSSDYVNVLLYYTIPIALIIVSSEIIRVVIRSQEDRASDVIGYVFCVLTELLIFGNLSSITSFYLFMEFAAITLFPAVLSNLLYHYISKRYGMLPNLVYRLIVTLYAYIIPIRPAMPEAMLAFVRLTVPIVIYVFIDSLYEKKRRYALEKKSKLAPVITGIVVVITAGFIALISNQFKYGTLIIATESMTGEINKGDAIIFEEYTGQPVEEGQVIVFERSDSMVVHRVVKIENVDGTVRYTTKGDANEDVDVGYTTASDIVGLVNMKLPYVGYPSLWLRSLFD